MSDVVVVRRIPDPTPSRAGFHGMTHIHEPGVGPGPVREAPPQPGPNRGKAVLLKTTWNTCVPWRDAALPGTTPLGSPTRSLTRCCPVRPREASSSRPPPLRHIRSAYLRNILSMPELLHCGSRTKESHPEPLMSATGCMIGRYATGTTPL